MHTWSDIAHAQQSKRTPRSGHLAACPAHECAQLRTHDRRAVGGEAPRPIQRERERPDRSAREQSETTERAELDSAAPTDRCCPPLAAPRCGRTPTMSRKRPARMGAHIPAQIEHENIIERAMTGPFKHSQQQKRRTRGKRGAAGQSAHRRNTQRGRIVQNARARGRRCRSERSMLCSLRTLSSTTCGTGLEFMFS